MKSMILAAISYGVKSEAEEMKFSMTRDIST